MYIFSLLTSGHNCTLVTYLGQRRIDLSEASCATGSGGRSCDVFVDARQDAGQRHKSPPRVHITQRAHEHVERKKKHVLNPQMLQNLSGDTFRRRVDADTVTTHHYSPRKPPLSAFYKCVHLTRTLSNTQTHTQTSPLRARETRSFVRRASNATNCMRSS